ncbi:hypothetical protein PS662_01588 [Pseudomonas fluorescens]|uniref:ABM domain-containing protein n=1 Tax=Pseudomonas fluorescens TaxID=294 RepID=A0A5E6RCR4_PSEFL|nr:antibiotic biosynthesis monooxygenase [Pseudomonas fluorescens]VVM66704.1 hypothetical protein PS662_01588 [Pseudomonas fluorescens]
MINSSSGMELIQHSNVIKISFRAAPPFELHEIQCVMDTLNAMPDCLSYTLCEKKTHQYDWSICGVWNSDEARRHHYESEHLQTLLHLLMRYDLLCVFFSEIDTVCLAKTHSMDRKIFDEWHDPDPKNRAI